MKILFDNLLLSAEPTITATNESTNYPVSNLTHPFLRKRFQMNSSATSETITIEFSSDQSVNSFFLSYNNVPTSVQIIFYNSSMVQIYTDTDTSGDSNLSFHMSDLTTVRTIEIICSASVATTMYVGGVGVGTSYELPYLLANYKENLSDNSYFVKTDGGQSSQNYIEPLNKYELSFREWSRSVMLEIREQYKAVGRGPIYVDITEDNSDFLEPMYATINVPDFNKDNRKYRLPDLIVEEAR